MSRKDTTVYSVRVSSPMSARQTPSNLPALNSDELSQLGLTERDTQDIRNLVGSLDSLSPDVVLAFGQEVAQHTAQYTEDFLAKAKNQDLEEAGKKLGQVVQLTQATKMRSSASKLSQVPVVGSVISAVIVRFTHFQSRYESIEKQMGRLMADVGVLRDRLAHQNQSFEQAFLATKEESRLLGMHVAAGKLKLKQLQAQADEFRSQPSTPFTVQELSDVEAQIHRLDIRVSTLLAIQQSSLQTLPQIRMVQACNTVLIEKFCTINEITLPAWKRQMILRLGLNEQKNAIAVADAVDKATNEFLIGNAKLLRQNAVSAASANQRLAIETSTLQAVQDELLRTLQDVIQVQAKGVEVRRQAEKQILQMRQTFEKQIGAGGSGRPSVAKASYSDSQPSYSYPPLSE